MRRHVPGLNQANGSGEPLSDSFFLVRVAHLAYQWHAKKPYYVIVFSVIEPKSRAGSKFSGHFYCNSSALWKLNWFLRDFGYDIEQLEHNEIDDKRLVGLTGVIKITNSVIHGTSLLKLDGFAPTSEWKTLWGEDEQKIGVGKAAL